MQEQGYQLLLNKGFGGWQEARVEAIENEVHVLELAQAATTQQTDALTLLVQQNTDFIGTLIVAYSARESQADTPGIADSDS